MGGGAREGRRRRGGSERGGLRGTRGCIMYVFLWKVVLYGISSSFEAGSHSEIPRDGRFFG